MLFLIIIFQSITLHQIYDQEFEIRYMQSEKCIRNIDLNVLVDKLNADNLRDIQSLRFSISDQVLLHYNYNEYILSNASYELIKNDDSFTLKLILNSNDIVSLIKTKIYLFKADFTQAELDSLFAFSKLLYDLKLDPDCIFSHVVYDCNGRFCNECLFKDKSTEIIDKNLAIDSEELLYRISSKTLALKQIKLRINNIDIYAEKYDQSLFCIHNFLCALQQSYQRNDWLLWLKRYHFS